MKALALSNRNQLRAFTALTVVAVALLSACGTSSSGTNTSIAAESSSATTSASDSATTSATDSDTTSAGDVAATTPATGSSATTSAAGGEKKSDVSVGLTTSIAGLGDQGFNDLAAAGVKKAEIDLGVKGTVVESKAETDYVPNLQGFSDDGTSLVYAVGFLMQDALKEVAQGAPDSKFAIIDANVDLPNVASITFKEEQGSFLAGAFAALMTKSAKAGSMRKLKGTMKLGFIGGGDIPLIHKFEEGFVQGAKAVDPSIQVIVSYVGSFTDAAKGKEFALTQYNSGADIVYQAAGPTGTGVIEAAKQLDRYVIGVDADQNSLAPNNVITSMQKKVDVAVYDTIKAVADGTFKPGLTVFGIENGGIGLAPFHGLDSAVPADVKAQVKSYEDKIKSGKIKITLSKKAGG
jgi:basic membrane protein A